MRGLVHPPRHLPIRISSLVILLGLFGQEHVQAQDIFSFSSNNSRETCQQWLEFQKSVRGATTLLTIQEYQRAIAPGRNPPWINCVNACADAEHKDPNRLWCARARIASNPPPSASFGPGSDQFNTNTDATNAGPNTPVMGNATTNADSGPISITDPRFYRPKRFAPGTPNPGVGQRRFAPPSSGTATASSAGGIEIPDVAAGNAQTNVPAGAGSAPAGSGPATANSAGARGISGTTTFTGSASATVTSGAVTAESTPGAAQNSPQPPTAQQSADAAGQTAQPFDGPPNKGPAVKPFQLEAKTEVTNTPPITGSASYPAPQAGAPLQAGARQDQPASSPKKSPLRTGVQKNHPASGPRYAAVDWPVPNGKPQPLCFTLNDTGVGRTEIGLTISNGEPAYYTKARVTVTPGELIVTQLYTMNGRWVSGNEKHLTLHSGLDCKDLLHQARTAAGKSR